MRSTKIPNPPVFSVSCSDKNATYIVECMSEIFGNGIYGYYINFFDAKRVEKFLKDNDPNVKYLSVKLYDKDEVKNGIHHLVEAGLKGYT